MNDNPYSGAADYRRWQQAIARCTPAEVDPVVRSPFTLQHEDAIVSAGSCFAQHIARHLLQAGFNYLITETAHPLLSSKMAANLGYGLYSARYGNVYTARQLLQLLRRAYGDFRPADDLWEHAGRYFDPFRPSIQSNGFATARELLLDREQHFAAVRQAFKAMDVFIFTLGLTECWVSAKDGAAYPLCPGTIAGQFDSGRHTFINFSVSEVVSDLKNFIDEARVLRPKLRVLLTVSPVPLAATALDRHVLVSTDYSKAVLRVAAEELSRLPNVAYFPAYEIVTGAFSRGRYFAQDCRSVTEEGVDHVMRLFFRHLTPDRISSGSAPGMGDSDPDLPPPDPEFERMQRVVTTLCDEERLGEAE